MKKTFILSCLFASLFTSALADGKLTPTSSVTMTDDNYPGLTVMAALRTVGLWTPLMGYTEEKAIPSHHHHRPSQSRGRGHRRCHPKFRYGRQVPKG